MPLTNKRKQKLRRILGALDPSLKGRLMSLELKEDVQENVVKLVANAIERLSLRIRGAERRLLDELEKKQKEISQSSDPTPQLLALRDEFNERLETNNEWKQDIINLQAQLQTLVENDVEGGKKMKEEIEDKLKSLRVDFYTKLANVGGGSMNRQINVNSSVMSSKYTDVNFLAGTNVTLTASDDNALKRVNVTIAAAGAVLTIENAAGTVDGNNAEFTVTNDPLFVMVSGAVYVDGDGYTKTGSGPYALTFNSAPWTTPRAFYNG